jgi:hypothetical protein
MNLVILFRRILKRAAYQGTSPTTENKCKRRRRLFMPRNRTGKTSALEGVDGLHVGPEKEFNKGNSLIEGTQLLVDQMSLFHSVCKWQKSVKASLKRAMQMARLLASSRQRQVREEWSQIDRGAQEEQALRCALIALIDEEG